MNKSRGARRATNAINRQAVARKSLNEKTHTKQCNTTHLVVPSHQLRLDEARQALFQRLLAPDVYLEVDKRLRSVGAVRATRRDLLVHPRAPKQSLQCRHPWLTPRLHATAAPSCRELPGPHTRLDAVEKLVAELACVVLLMDEVLEVEASAGLDQSDWVKETPLAVPEVHERFLDLLQDQRRSLCGCHRFSFAAGGRRVSPD